MSRSQARARASCDFALQLRGPDEVGMSGYKGFYYHFLDMESGARFETAELSTVDTALLLGGVLRLPGTVQHQYALGTRNSRSRGADL